MAAEHVGRRACRVHLPDADAAVASGGHDVRGAGNERKAEDFALVPDQRGQRRERARVVDAEQAIGGRAGQERFIIVEREVLQRVVALAERLRANRVRRAEVPHRKVAAEHRRDHVRAVAREQEALDLSLDIGRRAERLSRVGVDQASLERSPITRAAREQQAFAIDAQRRADRQEGRIKVEAAAGAVAKVDHAHRSFLGRIREERERAAIL